MIGKFEMSSGNDSYFSVIGNTVSGCTATAPDMAGALAGQIMGDMSNYEIKNNTITTTNLQAEKVSPIAVLREGQSTVYTSVLAANITGNTWDLTTYNNTTYTYTNAETGAGDQVINGTSSTPGATTPSLGGWK